MTGNPKIDQENLSRKKNGNLVDLEDVGVCGEPRRGAQEQIERVQGRGRGGSQYSKGSFSPFCALHGSQKGER